MKLKKKSLIQVMVKMIFDPLQEYRKGLDR